MKIVAGILISVAILGAQSEPRFLIADVHAATKSSMLHPVVTTTRGDRFQFRHATLIDLIAHAWSVSPDRIIGGPASLAISGYDIAARIPEGTNEAGTKLMLRELLTERFGLQVHNEMRPTPAYILTAGKKTQLRTSDAGEAASGCKIESETPAEIPLLTYSCRHTTMAQLAGQLGQLQSAWYYVGDYPIIDRTGLDTPFDFAFQYHRRERVAQPGAPYITLAASLARLGLQLEAGEPPLVVLVIDSVNQTPIPNPPEAAKIFPPLPHQFEVADLKPSDPDTKSADTKFQPGGRVLIRGWRLIGYLEEAWNLQSDDWVTGAPPFMQTDRWDLIAKAPPEAGDPLDEEALDEMLKSLLIDRFRLQVHTETRTVSAWTLSTIKPKMQPAAATERTRCFEGAAILGGTDTRVTTPVLGRMLTCRNMPMPELASRLQFYASGYVHSEVLDETGLTGGYNFTISFSKLAQFTAGSAAGADPNGALSIAEALEKQLGLKLQQRRRPAPVLVIDHIDREPAPN